MITKQNILMIISIYIEIINIEDRLMYSTSRSYLVCRTRLKSKFTATIIRKIKLLIVVETYLSESTLHTPQQMFLSIIKKNKSASKLIADRDMRLERIPYSDNLQQWLISFTVYNRKLHPFFYRTYINHK
jgi:hypothetical protein